MGWYRVGTATFTSGSTAVTGNGTAWVANVKPGHGIIGGPDKTPNEILSVNGDGSITLAEPYAGASATGVAYKIIPTQGLVQTLATQAQTLLNSYSTAYESIGGKVAKAGDTMTGNLTIAPASGDVTLALRRASKASGQVALTVGGGAGGVDWLQYQPSGSNDYRVHAIGYGDVMTYAANGNVGVGLTNPAFNFHVAGSLFGGTITSYAPARAGGSVIGLSLLCNAPATDTYYKIAALPITTAGTLDSMMVDATLNDTWGSDATSNVRIIMGNRNSFSARFLSCYGAGIRTNALIQAYTESSGATSVYVVFRAAAFAHAEVNLLAQQAGGANVALFPFPDPLPSAPGTLVFSSATARPDLLVDNVGSFAFPAPAAGAANPLAHNGQMQFNAASNTSMRIAYRGTDGVTRTGTIALS